MPFPEYIATRTLSAGGAATIESNRQLKIRATLQSTKSLVWSDTGFQFLQWKDVKVSALGTEVTFNPPRTDLAGWKDYDTKAVIDVSAEGSFSHRYLLLIEYLDENDAPIGIPPQNLGPFALPDGVGTYDVDKSVVVGTVAGDQVSIPDLWSQLVADAEAAAAAAQAAIVDSAEFVGAQISTPGTPARVSLETTYGPVAIAASPEMSATYDALASGLRQTSEVYRRATTTVMASPPTVAVNAATSLTGGVLVTAANSPIQFENCVPLIEGTSLRQRRGAIPAGLATAASNNPFQVSFGFYGLRFELRLTSIDAAADVWIWVDGQPVSASPTALGAAGNKFVLVTFGSVGHRTITVINRRATYLQGVLREPTYSVFPPDHGGGPRVAILGDSLSISTGSSTLMNGWVPLLARIIGWPNVVACGEGGTGYVAAANPLYDYVTRVQDVASLDPAPDLVIVAGSQNDAGKSGVQAAAEACYVALRAALPGVPIIATTVLKPTSRSAGIIAVDDALIAATTAQDVPLIDCRDWFTGSGNVSSPSGVGNSDYFCSADGAHPSQAGHQFIANRITNALRNVGIIAFGV